MKKINKVLSMAMVGVLTLGGSQALFAGHPDHDVDCRCGTCKVYDEYINPKIDEFDKVMTDTVINYLNTPREKKTYEDTLKGDRMIPVDDSYAVGLKMPLVDGEMPLHHSVKADQYIYGREGAASIVNTVLSFVQSNDGIARKDQTCVQTFASEDKMLGYVKDLLYTGGVDVKMEKFSDMLHLQETMAAGEGKRMIVLDIDPTVISNKENDLYLNSYKDFVSIHPHTVIIKGIYVNENNEVTFSIFDPYTNLISNDISQHRLRAITLGMGYSNMLVIDYDKH